MLIVALFLLNVPIFNLNIVWCHIYSPNYRNAKIANRGNEWCTASVVEILPNRSETICKSMRREIYFSCMDFLIKYIFRRSIKVLLFADDLKLFIRVDTNTDHAYCHQDLDILQSCSCNGLSLNIDKCKALWFTRKQKCFHFYSFL